jgi:hypothetical protein
MLRFCGPWRAEDACVILISKDPIGYANTATGRNEIHAWPSKTHPGYSGEVNLLFSSYECWFYQITIFHLYSDNLFSPIRDLLHVWWNDNKNAKLGGAAWKGWLSTWFLLTEGSIGRGINKKLQWLRWNLELPVSPHYSEQSDWKSTVKETELTSQGEQ